MSRGPKYRKNGRQNASHTKRRDSIKPAEVCQWMRRWKRPGAKA